MVNPIEAVMIVSQDSSCHLTWCSSSTAVKEGKGAGENQSIYASILTLTSCGLAEHADDEGWIGEHAKGKDHRAEDLLLLLDDDGDDGDTVLTYRQCR